MTYHFKVAFNHNYRQPTATEKDTFSWLPMKLGLANYGETGMHFSRASAAWTATVEPQGWLHGVPGKEYPSRRPSLTPYLLHRRI